MSEIVELRQLFQDLIAPDLQVLKTDVKNVQTSMDRSLTSAAELAASRYNDLRSQIEASEARRNYQIKLTNAKIDSLVEKLEIDKRLTRIESGRTSPIRAAQSF